MLQGLAPLMFLLWLIYSSIDLDLKLIVRSEWDAKKKVQFIIKKYYIIIKHVLIPFRIGQSATRFYGRAIYYDTRFGLAGYQSMLTRHKFLMTSSKMEDPQIVVDVGANVGFFSMMILDRYPAAKVIAFEPIPQTYEATRRNLSQFPSATTFNMGMSDYTGKAKMSFNPDDSAVSAIDDAGNVEINLITLDHQIGRLGIEKIDLLKIDTETFEAHVLRGARKTLCKTHYLLIEVTIANNHNYTISSLMKLLNGEGYDYQLVSYRNYSNKAEGLVRVLDCLLVNIKHHEI